MRMVVGKDYVRRIAALVAVCIVAWLAMCLVVAEAYGAQSYTVMICNDPLAKSFSYRTVRNVSSGKTLRALNTPAVKPGEVRKGFETDETHVECYADLNESYYYRCFSSALDAYDAGRVTDRVCVAETDTLGNVVTKCGIKGTVIYCYLFYRPVRHSPVVLSAPSCEGTGVSRCSVCGKDMQTKPLGHEFETLKTKQPTCATAGQKTSVCMRCGQKRVEALPATGKHSYAYKSLRNGKHEAVCKNCHHKKKVAACRFAKNGRCELCGAPRLPANGVIAVGKHRYKIIGTSRVALCKVGASTKKLVIPASVGFAGIRFKVVAVAKGAAKNNAKLMKVCRGKNLEKIGKSAFRGCRKLKEVEITSGKLSVLGSKSFEGCARLTRFLCKSRISRAQLEKADVL